MNAPTDTVSATFTDFAQRAAELGAVCWLCDGAGEILAGPNTSAAEVIFDRSALLRAGVRAAAQSTPAGELHELFSGCFLVNYCSADGTIVALLMTEEALAEPQFAEIAAQLGMDRQALRFLFASLLQPNRSTVARLAKVMSHYRADLAQSRSSVEVVNQFNEHLSQTFEEISLLFRISHVLNSVKDPDVAMALGCEQISQVLPFKWIAIWFSDAKRVVPSLAGQLTMSGELRFPREQLIHRARALCVQMSPDSSVEVFLPDRHEMALICKSEVLAAPIFRDGLIVGMLMAGNKTGADPEISSGEIQFTRAIANFLGVFHDSAARLAEQQAQFMGTLAALGATIDAKDHYTRGHSARVSLLASQLAGALKLPLRDVERYRIAGLLHDVGKIGVPESTLQKCGKLTDEEFAQIKEHPLVGFNILKEIPAIEDILPGVLHHHERWDGRGYPYKLVGAHIPLIARCLAFADTFDAMSSSRSYRKAMPREHVLAEIKQSAGTQFDPGLVDRFLAMNFTEFDEMLARAK